MRCCFFRYASELAEQAAGGSAKDFGREQSLALLRLALGNGVEIGRQRTDAVSSKVPQSRNIGSPREVGYR